MDFNCLFLHFKNAIKQCEICRSTDREDVMLLCDGCDKGKLFISKKYFSTSHFSIYSV